VNWWTDSEPTHFQSDSIPSLIDIFATNATECVNFITQIDFPACKTNHDLIYDSMKFISPETNGDSTYYYRDYSVSVSEFSDCSREAGET
jgi:hypothetical protein